MLASKFTIFSEVDFLKEPWDEGNSCMDNAHVHIIIMPPTLLRMLVILRPHLLQMFASHVIISGCGHLQHSNTAICLTHYSPQLPHMLVMVVL